MGTTFVGTSGWGCSTSKLVYDHGFLK